MGIYDQKVKDAKGNDVEISEYKGKVLLIVNTATGLRSNGILLSSLLTETEML